MIDEPSIRRNEAPFGELEWNERLGWWESKEVSVPIFNGQGAHFTISLPAEDPNAALPQDILDAANAFLALTPAARADVEPHVWAYSREIAEVWEDCPAISREALWSHVKLNGISVEHGDDGLVYVNIECNCDWEPEHGLQLVLQGGVRWVRVSSYSGHLTEGEAYACPALDAWMHDPNATLPLRSQDEVFAMVSRSKRA